MRASSRHVLQSTSLGLSSFIAGPGSLDWGFVPADVISSYAQRMNGGGGNTAGSRAQTTTTSCPLCLLQPEMKRRGVRPPAEDCKGFVQVSHLHIAEESVP
ncbi:hypothetical protein EYF80_016338 [Liparis tanakae]|uniref:Uncharacterized protein n=1 Tax=Liparis tanakae TaxID=230148 RepID=A0A4Z2I7T2_9TELE|nr:hypothetical protein EYF80_016338 [Liparis tanakae]